MPSVYNNPVKTVVDVLRTQQPSLSFMFVPSI
jgi:hypothetical protein